MKYKIKDVTPKSMACIIGSCPSIYEGLRELTPIEMTCLIGACPSTYKAEREGKEVYLVIGKIVDPKEAGLVEKVGEYEALIEIPKALIDDIRK